MENTSDLEQLDRYLEAAQGSYDIPPLESSTPPESLLNQILNKISELLNSIFPKDSKAPDAEMLKTVVIVLLGSIALILLATAVVWIYRRLTKRSQIHATKAWSTAPESKSETGADSQDKDLSLAAWVRFRWKNFLAKNNLPPSLTPTEALLKADRPDRALIQRLNESMFWGEAQSLTQGQWEAEFERLEKEARE